MRAEPIPGLQGEAARVLATAATTLVRAAPTEEAVEPLLDWLRFVTSEAPDRPNFYWYPVGEVVEAVAALAPEDSRVHDAILDLVGVVRARVDDDYSGVLDFERSVRRAFDALEDAEAEPLYAKAAEHEMPRIDPYAAPDEPDEDEPESLPPFPEPQPAKAPPTFEPLDEDDLRATRELAAKGRELLGIDDDATAQAVAETIERSIRRGDPGLDEEELLAVGTALGDALSAELDWEWGIYSWDDGEWLGVASADRAYVHLPRDFVFRQRESGELRMVLLVNMLCARKLPPSKPGALTSLQ